MSSPLGLHSTLRISYSLAHRTLLIPVCFIYHATLTSISLLAWLLPSLVVVLLPCPQKHSTTSLLTFAARALFETTVTVVSLERTFSSQQKVDRALNCQTNLTLRDISLHGTVHFNGVLLFTLKNTTRGIWLYTLEHVAAGTALTDYERFVIRSSGRSMFHY